MTRKQRKRLRLEELEPRILFSADLPMAAPLTFDGESHQYVDSLQDRTTTTTEAASVTSYEIVFVDLRTPDFNSLVEDIFQNAQDSGRRIELILLDSDQDGLQQISDVLATRENVDALHIVSHGTDAEFMVGGSVVNHSELLRNAETLGSWSDTLSPSADLLIYGCDLASGAEGQHLISTLATLTGADVAASDDITGHASLGGDWELEYRVGSIETVEISTQLASDEWLATLAVGATNLNACDFYTEDTTLQLTPIVVTGAASGTVPATLTLSDSGAGALSTGSSGLNPIVWMLRR